MGKPDLLRLGVLLLGISALITASVILHAYYTGTIRSAPKERFYSYCNFNTVIIHANEELKDVRVLKPDGVAICDIKRIVSGSDEICSVPSEGVYVVQAGDVKRAVTCQMPSTTPGSMQGD